MLVTRYNEDRQDQLKRVKAAIELANLEQDATMSDKEWASLVRDITGSLAGTGRYSITSLGRVVAKEPYTPEQAKSAWRKLIKGLDYVVRAAEHPRASEIVLPKKTKNPRIDLAAAPDVWIHNVVRRGQFEATTAYIVTPTLSAWVGYAMAIITRPEWIKRIKKCPDCENYYLTPKSLGGPKPKRCERCARNRKRRKTNSRVRRHRTKLKQQQADI